MKGCAEGAPVVRITQSLTLSTPLPLRNRRGGKPAPMVSSKDFFGLASVSCVAADKGFLWGLVSLSLCHL